MDKEELEVTPNGTGTDTESEAEKRSTRSKTGSKESKTSKSKSKSASPSNRSRTSSRSRSASGQSSTTTTTERETGTPVVFSPKGKNFEDYAREYEKTIQEKTKKEQEVQVQVQRSKFIWNSRWIFWVLVSISVFVPLVSYLYNQRGSISVEANNTIVNKSMGVLWKEADTFTTKTLKRFSKEYPRQFEDSWIQLLAATTSTLTEKEPRQPSAIVLLKPPSMSAQFAHCLAGKIANMVNTAHFNITAFSGNVKDISADYFKKFAASDIQAQVKQYFKRGGRGIIISDVDNLSHEEQILTLHSLCDNTEALEKRAVILFPVEVPNNIYETVEWKHSFGGDISSMVLRAAWSEIIDEDNIHAHIARVANNIILLNNGDTCVD